MTKRFGDPLAVPKDTPQNHQGPQGVMGPGDPPEALSAGNAIKTYWFSIFFKYPMASTEASKEGP